MYKQKLLQVLQRKELASLPPLVMKYLLFVLDPTCDFCNLRFLHGFSVVKLVSSILYLCYLGSLFILIMVKMKVKAFFSCPKQFKQPPNNTFPKDIKALLSRLKAEESLGLVIF